MSTGAGAVRSLSQLAWVHKYDMTNYNTIDCSSTLQGRAEVVESRARRDRTKRSRHRSVSLTGSRGSRDTFNSSASCSGSGDTQQRLSGPTCAKQTSLIGGGATKPGRGRVAKRVDDAVGSKRWSRGDLMVVAARRNASLGRAL